MKCPHCITAISFYAETTFAKRNMGASGEQTPDYTGYGIEAGHCPECEKFIVVYEEGKTAFSRDLDGLFVEIPTVSEVIFPKSTPRNVEPEVPEHYKKDFLEACSVLSLSPKASAALSRRLLQHILREKFNIQHKTLDAEIRDFIGLPDVPGYLGDAVDAVRNIGNFAAHPLKDTNTGEIVDVEPGEAEWLLEVLETLFDFAFVQPQRLADRKNALNQKLAAMGKPEMKSKT